MQLNFTMSELIKSDIAIRHNINNMPDIASLDNMLRLITEILQPIREHFRAPVTITSGFRCNCVNELAGGAKNSLHTKGRAADIKVRGVSAKEVFNWIHDNLDFKELKLYDTWVHVGLRERGKV